MRRSNRLPDPLVLLMKLERGLGHRQTRDPDWLASQEFQLFWKWKSQAGRPRIPENIRKLIVQMAKENPTWGQARVKKILGACCLVAMSIWDDEETKLLAESYGALQLIDKTELSCELHPAIEECGARIRSPRQPPM